MRGLLILCLVGVGSAAESGYNYRPATVGFSGLDSGIGTVPLSSSGYISSGSYGAHTGVGSPISSSLGFSGALPNVGISSGGHLQSTPVITELNKEYYFHSAPEEEFLPSAFNDRGSNTLKKNLRVVFIKAPENNLASRHALQVAKQAVEDRTAIYVLTKQPDAAEVQEHIQQLQEIHSSKPEVRFVKYRTPQDAINAQRTIQAHYDALGGSSKISDEGVAPVLNYATNVSPSIAEHGLSVTNNGSPGIIHVSSSTIAPTPSVPRKTYLPSGL